MNRGENELKDYFRRLGAIPRQSVHIIADSSKSLLAIKSPYHARYIEFLKHEVPSSDRRWDPGHRIWFVNATYYNIMVKLCHEFFGPGIIEVNTERLYLLSPKPTIGPKKSNLNLELIRAIDKVEMDVAHDNPQYDIVETVLDVWKSGSISNEEALEALYNIINS
jgi:hypothetical protein